MAATTLAATVAAGRLAAATHAQSQRRNEKARDLYRGFPRSPTVVALYALQQVYRRRGLSPTTISTQRVSK